MQSFTERDLRASFVNVSVRERNNIPLPADWEDTPWTNLDYLGWRDRKIPSLGYVVVELNGAPVGIGLRQADGTIRTRPQCSWCEDVTLPNAVVAFNVKRTGQAGRNGNTVGTLACAHFECSANVRKRPPVAYIGFDVEAAREERIRSLQTRVEKFVRDVRDGV